MVEIWNNLAYFRRFREIKYNGVNEYNVANAEDCMMFLFKPKDGRDNQLLIGMALGFGLGVGFGIFNGALLLSILLGLGFGVIVGIMLNRW